MAFTEKIIDHPDFGEIKIVKSTRARRISIMMKPFEPARITVPVFISESRVEGFLREKEKWILRNRKKINRIEDSYTVFSENTEYSTREHELKIFRTKDETPVVRLKNRQIQVDVPEGADIQDCELQDLIRWGIQAAWRKEARRYLPERLGELSIKHRLPFSKVVIKNNRSRWGSCSSKNNINLSLHLMRLPEHLIDYVLVHELVHTIHRNHSRKFWKELENVLPGARMADKELKDYRIDIY